MWAQDIQISKIMPPTKFSDFMKEIEKEAQIEGSNAVQELEDLRKHYENERCLIQQFFEREQQKPEHLRAKSCLIFCPCSKCNPARL